MSKSVTAASYIRKAERALKEAQLLLREGATEGACNRAYCAMHDATHAALMAAGYEEPDATIKTHNGLIAAFGQKLVQSDALDPALGRSLNKVQDIRLIADYTCELPPLDQATWAVEEAETFVTAIRTKFMPPKGKA